MSKTLKLWTGLGAAALAGAVATDTASAVQGLKWPGLDAGSHIILVDGEGGEEGSVQASGGDRTEYLGDLALVEGHVLAAVALYKAGQADMAKTHMKHPADELFADLKPHFEAMKIEGFGKELEAVAAAVEASAAVPEVESALEALLREIGEARGGAMEAREAASAAVQVIKTAATEFGEGVKDGKVVETHEYQDAWGFVKAAQRLLAALPEEEKSAHKAAFDEMTTVLADIEAFFPDVAGKSTVTASPADFQATASRLELAAAGIK